MKTYIKKPVKIQAFDWDGTVNSIMKNVLSGDRKKFWIKGYSTAFGTQSIYIGKSGISDVTMDYIDYFELYIDTLEGPLKASKGDYIIRGIRGEYYSCKPDVFKATYDEVIKDED